MKDGETPPAPEVLSGDDVARFFNEKLPDLKCPTCGGEDFGIEFGEPMEYVSWTTGKDAHSLPNLRVRVVLLSCSTCFHMLPFSYQMILKWVARKKAGVSNDEI